MSWYTRWDHLNYHYQPFTPAHPSVLYLADLVNAIVPLMKSSRLRLATRRLEMWVFPSHPITRQRTIRGIPPPQGSIPSNPRMCSSSSKSWSRPTSEALRPPNCMCGGTSGSAASQAYHSFSYIWLAIFFSRHIHQRPIQGILPFPHCV